MIQIRQMFWAYFEKIAPYEVMLRDCDAKRLWNVYSLAKEKPFIKLPANIESAIDTLTAQTSEECRAFEQSFFLYKRDKAALAELCNNYCIWLAEGFDTMPEFAKKMVELNYQYFTDLMLRLK